MLLILQNILNFYELFFILIEALLHNLKSIVSIMTNINVDTVCINIFKTFLKTKTTTTTKHAFSKFSID